MADWFKFYDNSLDETRLQYAVAKLPEVISVWVGILSECSRHKSDTISWRGDEIELFGFSRRLNVSVSKVNEAVNLLCEIRYIEKANEMLKVLKWNDLQSEYCRAKTKKNTECVESVGTVSAQCRPRVEEKRKEKKEEAAAGAVKTPLKEFESFWFEEYPKYHEGKKYLHAGAKDAQCSKRLLSLMPPGELIGVAINAWKNPMGFNCKFAASISGFSSRINEIRAELAALAAPKPLEPRKSIVHTHGNY